MKFGIMTLFVTALMAFTNAHAAAYPAYPIRLVIPAAPGTATDGVARYITNRLGKDARLAMVPENTVGANGIIAMEYVARAPADGYTMLMSPSTIYINKILRPKSNYKLSDFTPVAKAASAYLVLVVPANSPFHTLQDAIKYMKAHPGKLSYSSGGTGSVTHLAFAMFASMAGVQALHIPYKGGDTALTDTISGQVAMTFTAIASAKGIIASGRLRALAVTGPRRSVALPGVPTISELGYKGYQAISGLGFMVPKGVPPAIVKRLSAEILKVVKSPEFAAYAKTQGLEVDPMDSKEYAADGQREMSLWQKAITDSGTKVQ